METNYQKYREKIFTPSITGRWKNYALHKEGLCDQSGHMERGWHEWGLCHEEKWWEMHIEFWLENLEGHQFEYTGIDKRTLTDSSGCGYGPDMRSCANNNKHSSILVSWATVTRETTLSPQCNWDRPSCGTLRGVSGKVCPSKWDRHDVPKRR